MLVDTINKGKGPNGALGRDRTCNLASGGPRDIHFTTRAHLSLSVPTRDISMTTRQ